MSKPNTAHSTHVSRRNFVKTTAAAALVSSSLPLVSSTASAAPTKESSAETAVKKLYETLTKEQKAEMCLAWDDPRRTKVSANWSVTKANVGSFSKEQQAIIHEIVKGITSEDGYDRFIQQMKNDHGGIERYAIAICGTPDSEQCCFMLTGRHLTLRADGNTTANTAFGGPIVYGHAQDGNSEQNLFFYQTKQANELFTALDGSQRKKALLARSPNERSVDIKDPKDLAGIKGSDLSKDQQELTKKVLASLFSPYRKDDVDEAMAMIEKSGGMDSVHMAFYQNGDLGDDGIWDIWRVETPTMISHFRGAPHVHAYINVATKS